MNNKITRRQLFKTIGIAGIATKLGFIKVEALEPSHPTKEEVKKESERILSSLLINDGKNGHTEGGDGYYIIGDGKIISNNAANGAWPVLTGKPVDDLTL